MFEDSHRQTVVAEVGGGWRPLGHPGNLLPAAPIIHHSRPPVLGQLLSYVL